MKKYLKNNDGMALTMVLVVMTIVMTLATAMAMFAYNSFVTARWMNDEKRAYYLAHAGVEATAHAYQNAVTKTSSKYDDLSQAGTFEEIDRFVSISQDSDARITSNRVYLTYTNENTNADSLWKNLKFAAYTPEQAAADPNIIGYFEAEIGNGTDLVKVKSSDGTIVEQEVPVKVIRAKGVSNGKTQTNVGYVTPSQTISPNVLYDDNGYLSRDGIDAADSGSVSFANEKFIVQRNKEIPYDEITFYDDDGWFINMGKSVIAWIYKEIYGDSRFVDLFTKTAQSNMVLEAPAKSSVLKMNPNVDNFYTFATSGDLFLDNLGIDATPTRGNYASIGLYGDEIVIDGDITMEVFYTNDDSLLNGSIWATIGNRYRLGTVVLGDATMVGTDRVDPLGVDEGGLAFHGKPVKANKVYFNGNVFLKVITLGGQTETYRVFNAGDMAYFYGGYTLQGRIAGKTVESRGIDLVKYFVDAVLTESDGHIYGEPVKEKMRYINNLYYASEVQTPTGQKPDEGSQYFTSDTRLVRKIDVKYDANGKVTVDGRAGAVDEIMQPSPIDVSTITWGRPRGSCDF